VTRYRPLLLAGVVAAAVLAFSTQAKAGCSAPANAIEAENCLAGTPPSTWGVCGGAGDSTIQGFATDISVNAGQTISFKIDTNATAYQLDIYRMGYYQGDGARLITTIQPSARLPQTQTACLTDAYAGLVDCGDWAVSASWTVPSNAVSGIYFARVTRVDTGGASHIVFVVRNDASKSNILFQTSDETWQAHNDYGGSRFYGRSGALDLANRTYKISYNRPARTAFVFYADYPMVQFLEANGYDVSYSTSVDAARSGSLITQHKTYISAGHDEYWSGPKQTSIETARSAGVHIVLFSGNDGSWKTRWENSIDGTNTPYRTLVSEAPMHSHRLPFRAPRKTETVLPAGTEDSGYLAGLTANWEKTKDSFSLGPVAKACSAPNAR
jgi:hypothetical protein